MHIAVRELKANLSRVLSRAREGEVIEVRSHNTPIARIIGIPPAADAPLRRLMAENTMTWTGGKPAFAAPMKLGVDGTPVSRMVAEDRW